MTTVTAPAHLVGELILVRLLVAGKRAPSLRDLRKQLERFFKYPPTAEQWQTYLDELSSAGLLTVKPFVLTDPGRARALEFLGLEALPPGANWKTVRGRYLVPKALGIAPEAFVLRRRIARAENLGAFLLKTHYGLPTGAGATLNQTLEALVCNKLGFTQDANLKGVKAAVLSQVLGASDRLPKDQLEKRLPRHVVGATGRGLDGIHEAILRCWVDGQGGGPGPLALAAEPPPDAAAFDLPAFAATVRAVARDCPTGRFGDNKVFISHVWRHLRQEPAFAQLGLEAFKARLVEANHDSQLHLSRADLVQVMDPGDVQESETSYRNAVFHFILLEGDRP
jgi:hypothetical protein